MLQVKIDVTWPKNSGTSDMHLKYVYKCPGFRQLPKLNQISIYNL